MGIYKEKKEQLIEKIKSLEAHISSDTAKKKTAEEKLKEVSRLAMAEEYNYKPRELDEIIFLEHSLLQKLRASGLSDKDLLKLVGNKNADIGILFYNGWDNDEDKKTTISKKIKEIIEANAKVGKYRTTCAHLGYTKGDDLNHLPVINPEATPIVKSIFEMRAKWKSSYLKASVTAAVMWQTSAV